MSTPSYLHPNDAWIDRVGDSPSVDLRDEEGASLFSFPRGWTNDQIMHALAFANRAYAKGVEHGQRDKAYEIRRVLDIKEPS